MKSIYIILLAVLLVLITSIIVVSIFFSLPVASGTVSNKKADSYHFVMIGQGTDEAFNNRIHSGAQQAAQDYNAAVEIYNVRPSDTFTVEKYLDMALHSKVDGIAIQIIDNEKIEPYLKKAEDLKIPIVSYETDNTSSLDIPIIGTNSFQVGNEAGKLAVECRNGSANTAVILNGFSSSEENVSKNLKITGIADAFKGYPLMQVTVVKKTDGGVFGAEKITSEILKEYPEVNLIIATNEMDTLGVIDMIVDFNKVGLIDVIGYGNLPEINKYIERNVMYGTVVSDPYTIGYESIHALAEIRKTGYSSLSYNTSVFSYTKKNIKDYKENG